MRRPLQRGTVVVAAMALLLLVGSTAAADQGDTIRISQRANGFGVNGDSGRSAISADGRYIAFESNATNLVTDDSNGDTDVFIHDVTTGTTARVSVDSNGVEAVGRSVRPAISADGRYVAFQSFAANLVPEDDNLAADIFVHDTLTATTTRVSMDSHGAQGNGGSYGPAISADGRYVAFSSDAPNLVSNDTNNVQDAFLHDTVTQMTLRVSIDSNGVQGNEQSHSRAISADGRFVAIRSDANNLVPEDNNGFADVFVHDRETSETIRVSIDSNGEEANSTSALPVISADGRFVAFQTPATNLAPGTDGSQVFIHDTDTGETKLVSADNDGIVANDESYAPSISADGRYVAFASEGSNLVPGDTANTDDVFVRDIVEDETWLVSKLGGRSGNASISANGRYVAFTSSATDLVPDDTNGLDDVFRFQFLPDPPTPGGEDPFTDDDGSTFESDIEALARAGITKGCNPPDNTRFCPSDPVTRDQMAAFLVRALGYSDDGGGDLFSDDDGSTFEADIDRLGTAGVTKGCNPPENTRFCPSDPVTRGQMAAFLVRALGYSDDGGGNLFADDDGSIFEADIDRLGTAGVTKGCNPPDNTRFCPSDPVTRGQMAAFLTRALDLK